MTTSSPQPFLEAIRAAADDDAPRLIYADWLDERADETSRDLAAYIRAACRANAIRVEVGFPDAWDLNPPREVDPPEAIEATKVAAALMEKNRRFWLRALKGLPLRVVKFHRGMLAWASMNADDFLTHGDALVERCPGLRLVQLHDRPHTQVSVLLERLLASSAIARLPGLQFVGRIGDYGAQKIAEAEFNSLTRLNLSDNGIGDRGAIALAESKSMPRLTHLDLRANEIMKEGEKALARLSARTTVKLTGNPCTQPRPRALERL